MGTCQRAMVAPGRLCEALAVALSSLVGHMPGGSDGAADNSQSALWHIASSGHITPSSVPVERWASDSVAALVGAVGDRLGSAQYGSFAPGAHAFDARVFGLSAVEAEAMNPHQRTVLEQAYCATHALSRTRASLSGAGMGAFVAVASSLAVSGSDGQDAVRAFGEHEKDFVGDIGYKTKHIAFSLLLWKLVWCVSGRGSYRST